MFKRDLSLKKKLHTRRSRTINCSSFRVSFCGLRLSRFSSYTHIRASMYTRACIHLVYNSTIDQFTATCMCVYVYSYIKQALRGVDSDLETVEPIKIVLSPYNSIYEHVCIYLCICVIIMYKKFFSLSHSSSAAARTLSSSFLLRSFSS